MSATEGERAHEVRSLTGSGPFDHAVAGFMAGAVSTACMHPLDLIKTRLQVETAQRRSFRGDMRRVIAQLYYSTPPSPPTSKTSGPTSSANQHPPSLLSSTSSTHAVGKNTVEQHIDTRTTPALRRHRGSWRAFYQGLSPNLVGATLSWGGYFWWFNRLKTYRYATDQVLTPGQQIAVSMEAGIYTACLTNPLWVVKTRMCLETPTPRGVEGGAGGGSVPQRKYNGVLPSLLTIWREEGLRGWYRGLLPALFGVGHGAVQFTCYEELKKRHRRQKAGTIDPAASQQPIHPLHALWMAATSKAVAALLTYPYQVVKSRLQAPQRPYHGVWDVLTKTFRGEDVAGFYKGLVPNLVRVVPATCITYLTYESLLRLIQQHGPSPRA